jgi:succinate dehydrogenase assembly factor 1
MIARHSGLQKEVFSLYRKFLRVAAAKDRTVHTAWSKSEHFFPLVRNNETTSTSYACREFRRQAMQVKRNDFKRIEHMIRKGEKQLKLLKMPGVQTFGAPQFQAP